MIGGLQMFDVPQILTNGKGSPDLCATTMIMYLNNHMYSKNYGMAGAVSTVLFLVLSLIHISDFLKIGRTGAAVYLKGPAAAPRRTFSAADPWVCLLYTSRCV